MWYKPHDALLVKETFDGVIIIVLGGCSSEYKEIQL